jgi:hypothetical protein
MAECTICKGAGFRPLPDDDSTVRQCICAYARALKIHMGAEIAGADTIKASPLYLPRKVDRTNEDLFLTGTWPVVLSHLKWALAFKGPQFSFRVVTDERLKTVWVGSEDYRARSKKTRDEQETFNSLSDLVVGGVDLLILRLGFLGYKNRAMPGILKETLMMRASRLLPTWIIEDPDALFMGDHPAFSDEVSDYISRNFERLGLKEGEIMPMRKPKAVPVDSAAPKPPAKPTAKVPPKPVPETAPEAPEAEEDEPEEVSMNTDEMPLLPPREKPSIPRQSPWKERERERDREETRGPLSGPLSGPAGPKTNGKRGSYPKRSR